MAHDLIKLLSFDLYPCDVKVITCHQYTHCILKREVDAMKFLLFILHQANLCLTCAILKPHVVCKEKTFTSAFIILFSRENAHVIYV